MVTVIVYGKTYIGKYTPVPPVPWGETGGNETSSKKHSAEVLWVKMQDSSAKWHVPSIDASCFRAKTADLKQVDGSMGRCDVRFFSDQKLTNLLDFCGFYLGMKSTTQFYRDYFRSYR